MIRDVFGEEFMDKKKVLIVYPEMMVGGSTTSLLAFLNCIDKGKYEVDLQLYKNKGPLMNEMPNGVNLLPEAFMHRGMVGSIVKKIKFILTGAFFKARIENKRIGKPGFSGQVMADFQAKYLSRKVSKHYDYAIGFLEGWADRYIAYKVKANKKIGWMHNTFANIAAVPTLEIDWMKKVDKIIFVADNCTEDFCKAMPEFAEKAETVYNITDSVLLRKRAEEDFSNDADYMRFKEADCFKIITVCRMSIYHKGLDRAIWCAKKLKDSGRKFLWLIVGDGSDFGKVKSLIEENGVSEQVVMIGNRLNPLPFIKLADAFCMLSRYEGKPMVITESMILGTPPIVTEYLSAHEQIKTGVDGFVVENADYSVVDVLSKCIDNRELLLNMRENLLSNEYGNSEYMKEIETKYLV